MKLKFRSTARKSMGKLSETDLALFHLPEPRASAWIHLISTVPALTDPSSNALAHQE